MKLAEQFGDQTLTDSVIAKLVTLENKDLTKKKKKKHKSFIDDNELTTETISSKRKKIESKHTSDSLLPTPIKVKLEDVYQSRNDNFEDDSKLQHTSSSEDEGPPLKSKKLDSHGDLPSFVDKFSDKKAKVSHLPIKFSKDSGSDSSSEDEHPSEKNSNSQFNSLRKEPDSDINSKNKNQTLLKNSSLYLSTPKNSENDSDSFREERIAEKDSWIQALQHKNITWTTQTIDFSLPTVQAKYSLIRVPKSINPNTLRNLKCSFDKDVLNMKQYLFQTLPKEPAPIFVSLNGPELVSLSKVIVLQKAPPLLPLNNIKSVKRENVSLPATVKARHPLFGVDYKNKIRIKKKIKKKILEAIERKVHLERKHKTKKHKVKRYFNSVDDEKDILDLLNLNNSMKNKQS